MNLKRAAEAGLLAVFVLFICGDHALGATKPPLVSMVEFHRLERVQPAIEVDPQFVRSYRLAIDSQVQAQIAAEEAARVAAEQARAAELAAVPLYGHGPIWTFDDCEYGAYGNVARITDILKSHGVEPGRGIFFMNGDCYRGRPDLVATLHASGYPIANHGNTHTAMAGMSYAQINLMITGGPQETRLFRPPYKSYDKNTVSQLAYYGYGQPFLWTLDSRDTDAKYPVNQTCSAILPWLKSQVRPDSVILMHMMKPQSSIALAAYLDGKSSC